MNSHERDEILSELISARALHPDMPLPDGVNNEEWAEIGKLAEVENALWDAAHGAPPIELDRVAAMLGLVPDQHLALDGKALARARQASGMTTSDLATRLLGRGWDATARAVVRWETQGGDEVPPALINAIAEELGTTAAGIATDKGSGNVADFEVDIRPDAAALRMFRSLSFTPWYALGEFVDNSISSYFQNRKPLERAYGKQYTCDIRISFDDRVGRLVVDDNAAGIARSEISRALRTGEAPPDTSVGLNLHGVGMKAAAFWWGRHLTIETWPFGDPNGWRVEIDLGEAGTQPQTIVTVHQIPAREQSGTRITVEGLWQNAPVAPKTRATIAAYLPSIYRKFISLADTESAVSLAIDPSRHVRLFMGGEQLSFEPPKLLKAPFWPTSDGPARGARSKLWRKDVSVRLESGKQINGWVGIMETMSRELSGFTLHYRGKGIGGVTPLNAKDSNSGFRPRQIFGQAGSYRAQSYIGEFDVTALGKSITTDSPLWTSDEEAEFVQHVLEELKDAKLDIWSMAVNFKRRRRNLVDKKNLAKAANTAAKQLRNAVSGNISHDSVDDDFAEDETKQPEVRFVITDREVHTHSFGLRFSTQRDRPFITLTENAARRAHTVVVNESHPLLDDLPPVDINTRTLLTRIALSLTGAEVFVESPDRHLVRTKMNQILDMVHPTPDDLQE